MNILVNIEVKSSLVSRIDESDATLLQRSYIAGKKGPCVKIDPKVWLMANVALRAGPQQFYGGKDSMVTTVLTYIYG